MSTRDFDWDYSATITPSADVLNPIPVGIHVSATSGTLDVEYFRGDVDGAAVTDTIYLTVGDYLKIKLYKITAKGAGTVKGLYRSKTNIR